MSGFRFHATPAKEELSVPSYIPTNKTYMPTAETTISGPIVVVDGIIVLATILRELNV